MQFNPMIDVLVIVGFAAAFAVPVIFEYRRKKNAPKPTGATKV